MTKEPFAAKSKLVLELELSKGGGGRKAERSSEPEDEVSPDSEEELAPEDRWERGERAFELAMQILGENASEEEILRVATELLFQNEPDEESDLELEALFEEEIEREEKRLLSEAQEPDWYKKALEKGRHLEQRREEALLKKKSSEERPPSHNEPRPSTLPSPFAGWKAHLARHHETSLAAFGTQGLAATSFGFSLHPGRLEKPEQGQEPEYIVPKDAQISFHIHTSESSFLFVFEEDPSKEPSLRLLYPFPKESASPRWELRELWRTPPLQSDLFDLHSGEEANTRWWVFFVPHPLKEYDPTLPASLSEEDFLRFFSTPHKGIAAFSFFFTVKA